MAEQLLTAFPDSDWAYYVESHDEDALLQIDETDCLEWEHIWMRPVKASDPDIEIWIECRKEHPRAEPWTGVRYK